MRRKELQHLLAAIIVGLVLAAIVALGFWHAVKTH